MIRGIHHAAINTANLDAMIAFYCDVVGFELLRRSEWKDRPSVDAFVGLKGSAARSAILRAGNAYLELFEYSVPPPEAGPLRACDRGYTHIALDVVDIVGEYERLSAKGVRFNQAVSNLGEIKSVYGHDPDGNIIELFEVTNPDNPLAMERTR